MKRKPENLAARRVLARKQIQVPVQSELSVCNLVSEVSDLMPLATWAEQVILEPSAVAIGNSGENITAVLDLTDILYQPD